MKIGLLDEIASRVGTSCLSDLRLTDTKMAVIDAISQIEAESFPLWEWVDAIEYITEESKQEFQDAAEAKQYLCGRLKE